MEKEKETLKFSPVNDIAKSVPLEKSPSSRRSSKSKEDKQYLAILNNPNNVKVKLLGGVTMVAVEDTEESYKEIHTLEDVFAFDKKKPNNIIGFIPSFYHEFVNTETRELKPFVKVGDVVTVKRKFLNKKGDIPRVVKNVYAKAINNMSVIIATLDDGDIVLTNQLDICK